jgi:tetratricopeptide (TPR) repeat protein
LLAFPYRLAPDYSYNQIPVVTSLFNLGFLVGALLGAGGLFVIIQGVRRQWAPEWGFGTAFVVLSLLPVSNLLFPIGTVMGERLLYLPSFGFCFLLGVAYRALSQRQALVVPAAALLLLGACSVRTYVRNPDWKDDLALFTSAVRASPRSAKAHFNLGNALRDQKRDMDGALRAYGEALRIYPAYSEAHYNAGVIYQQHVGMPDRAIEAYSRALMADSSHVLLDQPGHTPWPERAVRRGGGGV